MISVYEEVERKKWYGIARRLGRGCTPSECERYIKEVYFGDNDGFCEVGSAER